MRVVWFDIVQDLSDTLQVCVIVKIVDVNRFLVYRPIMVCSSLLIASVGVCCNGFVFSATLLFLRSTRCDCVLVQRWIAKFA